MNLSIKEQSALLSIVLLIIAGLAFKGCDRHEPESVSVPGQGTWRPVAEVEAQPGGQAAATPSLALAAGSVQAARTGLDLNTATQAELERLPGIGPAKASAIIATRQGLGGFKSVGQLVETPGIGPKTLEKLRPMVTVGASTAAPALEPVSAAMIVPRALAGKVPSAQATPIQVQATPIQAIPVATPAIQAALAPIQPAALASDGRINLNTASQAQLESLPGIGPVLAGRIVDYRRRHGRFRTVGQLDEVSGIGPKKLNRLRNLVKCGP